MLIQPSVQSASYGATFASSVSATGVEQTVSRAPLPPVEETSQDSATQNRRNPFPTDQTANPGQDKSAKDAKPEPEDSGTATASRNADQARQRLQEEADQALLAQLKARDREVRLHEAAHAAVGGRYAGAPTYQFSRGPDGSNYAVGGEVSISTGPVPGDPQASIEKARVVRAAALAPAEPSAQDRQVAAEAAQLELNARAELQDIEAAARAEEQKSREEGRAERQAEESGRKDQLEETTASDSEDTNKATDTPRPDPVAARTDSYPPAEAEKDSSEASDTQPRPDARERLEQILLGSDGILQQANRMGLTNPQNPYGKSGFLDAIA